MFQQPDLFASVDPVRQPPSDDLNLPALIERIADVSRRPRYAFMVLNLYKLFLIVDCENERAVNVYSKLGFKEEGRLRHEFFVDGEYRDVLRMAMFQPQYLAQRKAVAQPAPDAQP